MGGVALGYLCVRYCECRQEKSRNTEREMKIQQPEDHSSHRKPQIKELAKLVRQSLGIGGATMLLSLSSPAVGQGAFGAVLELSELDGSDGFVLNGVNTSDRSGSSVSSAGDINDDGFDDLIIGAPIAGFYQGESYVLFGGGSVGSTGMLELSSLNGSDGFVINGADEFDYSGYSVSSAGDINGDGFDDVIIGTDINDVESYVVFGGGSVGSAGAIELSELDGTDGFVLNGDNSDKSVSSAGDINGDGLDDLIIGARDADPNGDGSGESYVLFGNTLFGTGIVSAIELSELDGSAGFVINGVSTDDGSGGSVSNAGDINGDTFDDLIIGARYADPNGTSSGESYVLFGGGSVGSAGTIELADLNGTNGFVINGRDAGDLSGHSVSNVGDINGDGVGDLIIGAPGASTISPYGSFADSGESYVIFGGVGVGSAGTIELSELDGNDGFVINTAGFLDYSGSSVSSAGDINGDTFYDLIIGASRADPNGNSSGESYVIFGGVSVGGAGTLELSGLDGSDGFVLNGIDANDFSGGSVSSAGDINGDGLDDLIIGASRADPNGSLSGESYVVFGSAAVCNGLAVTVDLNLGQTPGPGDDVILGTTGADFIDAGAGDDTICGLGGADTILAGGGADYVEGGNGADLIFGEGGNDIVFGGPGGDEIDGGGGDDEIFGEAGGDVLVGRTGEDMLDGGTGVDSISGGPQADTIFTGSGATVGTGLFVTGGGAADTIFGGPDADDLRGAAGADTIHGEGGDDVITGGIGLDELFGGNGDDVIRGQGNRDDLFGGAGNDDLSGGAGDDDLDGGSGIDSCAGQAGTNDTALNCESESTIP